MIPSHKWRMTMDGAQRCRPSMQRRARLHSRRNRRTYQLEHKCHLGLCQAWLTKLLLSVWFLLADQALNSCALLYLQYHRDIQSIISSCLDRSSTSPNIPINSYQEGIIHDTDHSDRG